MKRITYVLTIKTNKSVKRVYANQDWLHCVEGTVEVTSAQPDDIIKTNGEYYKVYHNMSKVKSSIPLGPTENIKGKIQTPPASIFPVMGDLILRANEVIQKYHKKSDATYYNVLIIDCTGNVKKFIQQT